MSAAIGVAAGIAGIELSHPGLAHWGVAVIAAAVTGQPPACSQPSPQAGT